MVPNKDGERDCYINSDRSDVCHLLWIEVYSFNNANLWSRSSVCMGCFLVDNFVSINALYI